MKFYSAALALNLVAQWDIFLARLEWFYIDFNAFDA